MKRSPIVLGALTDTTPEGVERWATKALLQVSDETWGTLTPADQVILELLKAISILAKALPVG